uniref:Transposase (putative) gypsy type domain-containing protein n=1 Tax=Triticum urartu TaxID=4572 RepID=A0A8R7P1N8_TRIUA
GLGFPIHPFLQGLLEFYGIQLHNLTPGSILHISSFVALYDLFLGIEVHFGLWRKFFCLVPRHKGGSIFEVG